MTQGRLPWLLGLLAALLALRWLVPMGAPTLPATSPAITRIAPSLAPAESAKPGARAETVAIDDRSGPDTPRNAFEVRLPQPPTTPVPAPMQIAVSPPPSLPTAIALSSPALQVIGTWEDADRPGVFISTPQGTRLAHEGDLLLAEYRVIEILQGQVSLLHVATGREHRLPMPRAAGR